MTYAVALSMVCALITGYTAWKGLAPPQADYRTPKSLLAAEAAPAPDLTPATALFVGDSYLVGGFGQLTSVELGWVYSMDAEGGTGYISNGHVNSLEYEPYIDRLADDKAALRPDYVIVSGGRNDNGDPNLGRASLRYFRAVQHAFPEAKLIVILPFWQSPNPPEFLLTSRRTIAASARKVGAPTINPQGWLEMSLIGPDGVHPNPDGQQRIADRLTVALRPLVATGNRTAMVSGG